MVDADGLARRAGVVGPLVGFATTLAAIAASPTFRWTASALSDLGAPGAATPWLFNGGLVASALVTVGVAWVLWTDARHAVERLGTVVFLTSTVALALVGLFPEGTSLHSPVSITYFALLTVTLWVHGTGWALVGRVCRGLLAIWLGIAHVLAWIAWLAAGPGGIAVPEMGGSLLFYAWILLVVRSTPAGRASTGG